MCLPPMLYIVYCSPQAPIYLVVETSGSNAEHDSAKLEAFLEHVRRADARQWAALAGLCAACRQHTTPATLLSD